MGRYDRSLEQRFSEKYEIDALSGCWLWLAGINRDGYGHLRDASKTLSAHRVAWELHCGAIPDGMEIDHLCRVRRCVNPDHLEVVPHAENVRRGEPATKTHCKNGHPYDDKNTYWKPDKFRGGRRQCRVCNRAAVAALKARKGGAA